MQTEFEQLTEAIKELGRRIKHLENLELVQPVLGINPLTVSGNTTLTAAMYVVLVDCSLGAVTITLPLDIGGNTAGYEYHIKKIDASINAVTVAGNGTNIDGVPNWTITTQYDSMMVKRNLSEWLIL